MLQLTKTESIILEALKTWPKTKFELEELVDHGKDYSESFIKVIVSNINRKAGKYIIEWYNEDWYYKYRLTDERIEFQLAKGIEWVLEEIRLMRSVDKEIKCNLCKYKVDHDTRRKTLFIIIWWVVIFAILVFLLGYQIGFNSWRINSEIRFEIDDEDLMNSISK